MQATMASAGGLTTEPGGVKQNEYDDRFLRLYELVPARKY